MAGALNTPLVHLGVVPVVRERPQHPRVLESLPGDALLDPRKMQNLLLNASVCHAFLNLSISINHRFVSQVEKLYQASCAWRLYTD